MVFGWTPYPTLPKSIALPPSFSFHLANVREERGRRRGGQTFSLRCPPLCCNSLSQVPTLACLIHLTYRHCPPSLPTIPTPLWCDFEGWSDILWSWLHLQCCIELEPDSEEKNIPENFLENFPEMQFWFPDIRQLLNFPDSGKFSGKFFPSESGSWNCIRYYMVIIS